VDVRRVLDATATHLARATRSIDILRDRCAAAIDARVADRGSPIRSDSPVHREWRRAVDQSYPQLENLRVDRERLRIRLRTPQLLAMFQRVESAARVAREPCVSARLGRKAAARTEWRLQALRNLTSAYYLEVVR